MTVAVMYLLSESEYEEDLQECMDRIRRGECEIWDDEKGEVVTDFTTYTDEEMHSMAENELGDQWCTLYVYDEKSLGNDGPSAKAFASLTEAQAYVEEHHADQPGEFVYL